LVKYSAFHPNGKHELQTKNIIIYLHGFACVEDTDKLYHADQKLLALNQSNGTTRRLYRRLVPGELFLQPHLTCYFSLKKTTGLSLAGKQ